MTTWIQPPVAAPIGKDPEMKEGRARYAVDIRGPSVHTEVDALDQIPAVVDGHAGRAHVFDRQTKALVFHGTMDELREALRGDSVPSTEDSPSVA
jgi:hypothetical protein